MRVKITFTKTIIQQCPECRHLSVYYFEDVVMCTLCGWEAKRSEAKNSETFDGAEDFGSQADARSFILGFKVPSVRRLSKRARKRARAAALEHQEAQERA